MEPEQLFFKKNTLISPLGLSPGLLYSALLQIQPGRLVVLTSAEGERSLAEIFSKASYSGKLAVVRVKDPFNCFGEAGELVEELMRHLPEEGGITVNLTGGTTALQFIIQRAGTVLESRGRQVSYIALVDRRSATAQRENPWVVGELIRVI